MSVKVVNYPIFQGSVCAGVGSTIASKQASIDISGIVNRINSGVLRLLGAWLHIQGSMDPCLDELDVEFNGAQVFEAHNPCPWVFTGSRKYIDERVTIDPSLIQYTPKADVTVTIHKPAWAWSVCFTGSVSLVLQVQIVKKPLFGPAIPSVESPAQQAVKELMIAALGAAGIAVAIPLVVSLARRRGAGGAK